MKIESIVLAMLAGAIAWPAAADELNLPSRKSGEWQMSMQVGGRQMVTRQCVDESTDKEMMRSAFAEAGQKCSTIKQSQSGNTFTVDATCTLSGGITTNTHAIVTGDFQSEYTVDATTDTTGGPPQMPKHSEIKQDVKWVGACPAGMKPGDIQMPGLPAGMNLNLKQLQQMQQMMKPPG